MRCVNCQKNAVIRIKRHHVSFCKDHFNDFFMRQVKSNLKRFKMIKRNERVMVCVSGGKDSMVLWKVLTDLGCDTVGLYINLGIENYSDPSGTKVDSFAKTHQLNLEIIDLKDRDLSIPTLSARRNRPECSVCGTIKRYYFDKTAYDLGVDVVATGHNLDDEAARLLGNTVRWDTVHMEKQSPTLKSDDRMLKRKIKPLISLTEQEVAAYAFLNKIEYFHEECPMSVGATSMVFKDALNRMENEMPGMKQYFYFQFLKERHRFRDDEKDTTDDLIPCKSCGFESYQPVCSFCKLVTPKP